MDSWRGRRTQALSWNLWWPILAPPLQVYAKQNRNSMLQKMVISQGDRTNNPYKQKGQRTRHLQPSRPTNLNLNKLHAMEHRRRQNPKRESRAFWNIKLGHNRSLLARQTWPVMPRKVAQRNRSFNRKKRMDKRRRHFPIKNALKNWIEVVPDI